MVLLQHHYIYKDKIKNKPMHTELLRKLGLSEGEIKIYTALLILGLSPVNKLHEKTGIERRNIYDILNKLIEKGLVSYTDENKKRSFQLAHPKRLLGYIEEKKASLEETKQQIENSLHSLLQEFQLKKPEIRAETYRGKEGIKAIWEDMLNYPATYWLGSGRYVPKNMPAFFQQWNTRRIRKKIKWLNLMREEMKKEIKVMPFEQVKYLPPEFSGSPTVIGIYGNKVVNFLFGENLFAFVIESKELAENYRRYHKYLWERIAKQ